MDRATGGKWLADCRAVKTPITCRPARGRADACRRPGGRQHGLSDRARAGRGAVAAVHPEGLSTSIAYGPASASTGFIRSGAAARLGPEQRDHVRGKPGIWCRPAKTRRKRRHAVFIPLSTVDALEFDRWTETPIKFTNARFKAPVERHRDDLYLYPSPRGRIKTRPRTSKALYQRRGAPICKTLWRVCKKSRKKSVLSMG